MLIESGFDFTRTYYLSGPMAGYEEHNFPAFVKASYDLRHAGVTLLPAHEILHRKVGREHELQWHDYLRTDLIKMLQQCHGIILLKGWPQSKGAKLELDVALALEYPAWYYNSATLTNLNRST